MAIEDYNKAITTDPNYVPAYNNRGNAYKNKGQYDKAIEDYNKSIAIDSKRVAAYYNLACAYSLQGNQSKACDYLSIAIEKGYKNWEHIKKRF